MRDSPNMSYCAFGNTRAAVVQLIEILEQALDGGAREVRELFEGMSNEEHRAFESLPDRMAYLTDLMNEFTQAYDDTEDFAEDDSGEFEEE